MALSDNESDTPTDVVKTRTLPKRTKSNNKSSSRALPVRRGVGMEGDTTPRLSDPSNNDSEMKNASQRLSRSSRSHDENDDSNRNQHRSSATRHRTRSKSAGRRGLSTSNHSKHDVHSDDEGEKPTDPRKRHSKSGSRRGMGHTNSDDEDEGKPKRRSKSASRRHLSRSKSDSRRGGLTRTKSASGHSHRSHRSMDDGNPDLNVFKQETEGETTTISNKPPKLQRTRSLGRGAGTKPKPRHSGEKKGGTDDDILLQQEKPHRHSHNRDTSHQSHNHDGVVEEEDPSETEMIPLNDEEEEMAVPLNNEHGTGHKSRHSYSSHSTRHSGDDEERPVGDRKKASGSSGERLSATKRRSHSEDGDRKRTRSRSGDRSASHRNSRPSHSNSKGRRSSGDKHHKHHHKKRHHKKSKKRKFTSSGASLFSWNSGGNKRGSREPAPLFSPDHMEYYTDDDTISEDSAKSTAKCWQKTWVRVLLGFLVIGLVILITFLVMKEAGVGVQDQNGEDGTTGTDNVGNNSPPSLRDTNSPTTAPTIDASLVPTAELTPEYKYPPPDPLACQAYLTGPSGFETGIFGLIGEGNGSNTSVDFDFNFDVELIRMSAVQEEVWLREFQEHLMESLVPLLIGCLDDSTLDRRLRKLQASHQSEIRYVIQNAKLIDTQATETQCPENPDEQNQFGESSCFIVTVILELSLKGEERIFPVLSLLANILGELAAVEEEDKTLVQKLGLPRPPFRSMSVLGVQNRDPSLTPSKQPSLSPTISPSLVPSASPSSIPSTFPTESPSLVPSEGPSSRPSLAPSIQESNSPSSAPSKLPSISPSRAPSIQPSRQPSRQPSQTPSHVPSLSLKPSLTPSLTPSKSPSLSNAPSNNTP